MVLGVMADSRVIHPGMADKIAVARALRELGMLLEVQGENPFKVRAYENGARALEELPGDLDEVIAAGTLTELPGIGKALAEKIEELARTGRLALLDRVRAELPAGIGELLRIPDLGPKKIAALHAALGIGSVAELEAACRDGRVREVKGFGEKTEKKILEGIHRMRTASTRVRLSDAREIGNQLVRLLRATGAADRIELAGSARRWKETVGDLDIVAVVAAIRSASPTRSPPPRAWSRWSRRGTRRPRCAWPGGLSVDLRVVPPGGVREPAAPHDRLEGAQRPAARPGPGAWVHAQRMGAGAARRRRQGPASTPRRTSTAPWGSSPSRPSCARTPARSRPRWRDACPSDLVRLEDVKGMVHVHTSWSDGRASARGDGPGRRGHGDGVPHRHRPQPERRLRRRARRWPGSRRSGTRSPGSRRRSGSGSCAGTEADILETGALDWPDAVLEQLDVVIASVHSRMKMDADQMTRRHGAHARAAGLQDLGARHRPAAPRAGALRPRHGEGARRGGRLPRGHRGERRPAPARHGAPPPAHGPGAGHPARALHRRPLGGRAPEPPLRGHDRAAGLGDPGRGAEHPARRGVRGTGARRG